MSLQQQAETTIGTNQTEFFTISEAASFLKINRTTFWKLCNANFFNPIYVGKSQRYSKSELLTFLNKGGRKL